MGLLVNAYAPRRYDIARVQVTGRSFLVDPTPDRAAAAQAAVTEAVSPNERLQLRIQPWSSYVIVPLFVLANAGVLLTAETLRAAGDVADHVGHRGRAGGGQADRRDRGHVAGAADTPGRGAGHPALGPAGRRRGLSGIGFTVALFVTELALDDPVLVAEAKIGILAGSVLAGVVGWLIFRLAGERGGQCAPSGLPVLPPRPWRPVA